MEKNKFKGFRNAVSSWIDGNRVLANILKVVIVCFTISVIGTTAFCYNGYHFGMMGTCAVIVSATFFMSLCCIFPIFMTSAIISSVVFAFAMETVGYNSPYRYFIIIGSILLFLLLFIVLRRCWPNKWKAYADNQKSEFKQIFDRIISQGHTRQLIWLVGLLFAIYVILASIMRTFNAFGFFPNMNGEHWNPMSLTYMLLTDPGTLGGILNTDNRVGAFIAIVCVAISLLGAFLFTGLLISVFSNFLQRRAEDFQKGRLRYSMKDHIIFLGFDETLPYIVRQTMEIPDNMNKKIVIQTHIPTEEVREEFKTIIKEDAGFNNIIFYNGRRDSREDIEKLDVMTAYEINIIGNRSNDNHDELNLTCLKHVLDVIGAAGKDEKRKITILLEDYTRYIKLKDTLRLDNRAMVVARNFYADWARIIFNKNNNTGRSDLDIPNYPSLVPTSNTSKQSVNVIIHGMTRFGVGLGVEAILRLPDEIVMDTPINPVITFICKNAREEMNLFMARYEELFKLVDYSFIDHKKKVHETIEIGDGKSLFKIEFVEGDLYTPSVREMLESRCMDENTKITIFTCIGKDTTDLNSGLYLPQVVLENANVFILQRHGQETLKSISTRNQNIYPFGMNLYPWYGVKESIAGANSYNRSLEQRRIGNYEKALAYNERNETIRRIFYEKNSIEIVDALVDKCITLSSLGRETEPIMKDVLPILKYLVSQDNPEAQYELARCYGKGIGVEKDLNKAVEWYTKAAQQGYAYAQTNLGNCYLDGKGVKQDQKKAVEYFVMAAKQGDEIAQNNLGNCYYNGQGVNQDYKKAVELFTMAAQNGDADALFNLGACYYNGEGVEQDYKKAVKYFSMAAEQGNVEAQFNLGNIYYDGEGVEQNYKKAVEYYAMAAEQGDAVAQYNLGNSYYNGEGVEQNLEKALEYYKMAAEQGDTNAKNEIGTCYYNGEGVEQDYKKAVEYFTMAAQQGNAIALCNLGKCYFEGLGVGQDYKKAVEYYTLAAQKGDAEAQYELGNQYYFGRGVEQDYKKAVEWYTKAAQQGDAIAQFNLGLCYYHGEGTKRDFFQGAEWMKRAADQKDAKAQYMLGYFYLNGTGVMQSDGEAYSWFILSAQQNNPKAQYQLGNIFKNGLRGIKKDYTKAVEWYTKAAQQGDGLAQYSLAICYAYGQGVEMDELRAFDLYNESAKQNIPEAFYALGNCYEEGKGTVVDKEKAIECYEKAVDLGHGDAVENLNELRLSLKNEKK